MKNLKKVLALVLCVAMVMGLALTSSAKTFSDTSTVKNTEAVDVVSSIGVINGFTDGTFRGADTVTRAQMAKMICFVLNSGDDVGDYYSAINAYTDCASHWAKGYIAYCNKMGIVAGMGNGKFAPDGTVTGTQAAKMLLVALGYNATNEGYLGKGWDSAVLKDAKDAGLLDDMGKIDMSAAMSRDSAAQMIFNALQATMVEYNDSGTKITIGDTVINTSASDAEKKTSTDKQYSNIDDDTKGNDGKTFYIELGEECFDELYKVASGANGTDDLGRPAHTWYYGSKKNSDKVGTYGDSADNDLILNKAKDAYTVLTDSDYMDYDAADIKSATIDGHSVDATVVYINGDKQTGDLDKIELKSGDVCETFEDSDREDHVTSLVVTRYTVAKIDSIDTSLSSTYTDKGASCSIELKKLNDNFNDVSGIYYDAYEGYKANDDGKQVLVGFSADTYKKGTILAVAVNNNKDILTSSVANVVEGSVSTKNTGNTPYFMINSTKYYMNTACKTVAQSDSLDYDGTYTIYTDENDYVVGYDTTSSAKLGDVYYATGIVFDESGTFSSSTTYYAQAVSLKDGKVSSIKMEKDSVIHLLNTKESKNIAYGAADADVKSALGTKNVLDQHLAGLYTFTDSDGSKSSDASSNNGKFWAEVYDHSADSSYYTFGVGEIGDDLTRSDSNMKVDGHKVYLNDSTNYVKVEDIGEDISVTTVTGGTSAKKVGSKDTTNAMAICSKSGSNYVATYIVLISKDFAAAADSSDIVYVTDTSDTSNSKGTVYKVIFMDGTGTQKEITVDDKGVSKGFYSFTVDSDDVYTLSDDVTKVTTSFDSDKDTGYLADATLSAIYSNQLTAKKAPDIEVSDIDFADKAVVYDDRSSDDQKNDVISSDINTVDRLADAIEKDDWTVKGHVFYDDGKVVLVVVTSMDKVTHSLTVTNSMTTGYSCDVTTATVAQNGTCKVTVSTTATAAAMKIEADVSGGGATVSPSSVSHTTTGEATYTFTVSMGTDNATLTLTTAALD